MLVAALLELKARGLFPDEAAELDGAGARGGGRGAGAPARRVPPREGGRRVARRAAGGRERRASSGSGPAPLAPRPERRLAPEEPEALAVALRALARTAAVSLAHLELSFPPVTQFLERFRAVLARRRRFDFDAELEGCRASSRRWPFSRCWSCGKWARSRSSRPRRSRRSASREPPRRGERCVDRPLRLIAANPLDRLARTVEALLVVASRPLSVEELAEAANDDPERVETALGPPRRALPRGPQRDRARARRRRLGARASREAAEACGRLFERPVERGLSQAALETLAVIAYLGPSRRPEIARIRGVSADSVVAGLAERGLSRRTAAAKA